MLYLGTFVTILLLYIVFAPLIITRVASSHMGQIYNQQSQILRPSLEQLTGARQKSSSFACFDRRYTALTVQTVCRNYATFPYATIGSHRSTIAQARALDKILQEQDWEADRPQDPYTTVEAMLTYDTWEVGQTSRSIPLHKNVGKVSCNLDIYLSLPLDASTNKTTQSTVNINTFSCHQTVAYFKPKLLPGQPEVTASINTILNRVYGD